jgi:hypothetical protein
VEHTLSAQAQLIDLNYEQKYIINNVLTNTPEVQFSSFKTSHENNKLGNICGHKRSTDIQQVLYGVVKNVCN